MMKSSVAFVLCISLCACTLKKRDDGDENDVRRASKEPQTATAPKDRGNEASWQRARDVLIDDEHNHFRGDPYYSIDDPNLIDPILQRILDRKYDGTMPEGTTAIKRVSRRAMGSYAALNHSEAGLVFLQQRIDERYLNPPTSIDGNQLIADFDTAPGKLEERRPNVWAVAQSPVVQGESWKTKDAAEALQRLGSKHEQTVIIAKIRIPLGTRHRFWEYRWIRHQERIALKRGDVPNWVWVADVPGGDWAPFISGERSLLPKDMEKITMVDVIWEGKTGAPL
jgi:hypothetical protein